MVGMILVEPSGENRIVVAGGALEHLRPDHVEAFRAQLAAADIVVVSLEIPVETAVAALRIAREAGTRTLLNPAPAQALSGEVWGLVDIVTPNRTEAAILLGDDPGAPEPPGALAAALHARGAETVVLTLGADGALVHDHLGARAIDPVVPPSVVDTTGAGDAFTAALAVELAAGRSTDDAVRFATRVGAHVVGIPEVIPSLPRRADLNPVPVEGFL
jgi:ribokinase